MTTIRAGGVKGPASATDNAVARFDLTTGKLIQDSAFLIDDTGNVPSFGGNITFPTSQVASANANTLDDYEEGDWTPVLTFATPGNLSVTYSSQLGRYTKIGRHVTVEFNIQTSAFTHTTASGNGQITGLPFTAGGLNRASTLHWQGVTKANYTDLSGQVGSGGSSFTLVASGSGQAGVAVTAADMPTGGAVTMRGFCCFSV